MAWDLPALAVALTIYLVLGANTQTDAANTSAALRVAVPMPAASPLDVLAEKDTRLYQAIFAAQEKADWATADRLIRQVADGRLLGHVLADRYQRRAPSPKELQDWFSAYADLPEAAALYQRAHPSIQSGIAEDDLASPWSGAHGSAGSAGFHKEISLTKESSPAAVKFAARLSKALHSGDPLAAETLLEAERRRRKIPAEEAASATALIAESFFFEGLTGHARYLTSTIARSQNPLALWINGLAAWKQNDASAAARSFALLAAQPNLSPWNSTAAAFWAYRAAAKAGDDAAARTWLTRAAAHPHSFYGLLAANLLGREAAWSWQLPKLDAHHIETLKAQKAGWRALALLQIGRRDLAKAELRYLNPQGRRDLQQAMLALAEAEHMPSLVLQLGGLATRADGTPYDAALYPVPPWQPPQGFSIDRALVYALMRHESLFDPQAVSHRGACGLMQMMPTTAAMVSGGSISGDEECSARLLDPATNIALAQKYVMRLAEQPQIGNNLMLLLAAYNGGPAKLSRWLQDSDTSPSRLRPSSPQRVTGVQGNRDYKNVDPLLFLENVPARETRFYVQQVLVHYWIYRARLAEPQTSLAQLAEGQWPRFSLREEQRPRTAPVRQAALPQPLPSSTRIDIASRAR